MSRGLCKQCPVGSEVGFRMSVGGAKSCPLEDKVVSAGGCEPGRSQVNYSVGEWSCVPVYTLGLRPLSTGAESLEGTAGSQG